MALAIVCAIFIGGGRSVSALRKRVTDVFTLGENKDGLGIAGELQTIATLAANMLTMAEKYLPDGDAALENLRAARQTLAESDTPKESYRACADLEQAMQALYHRLGQEALSDRDQQYREGFILQMNSSLNIIRHDAYNDAAQAYNDEISRFPASVFAGLFGIGRLEYYGE